MLASLLASVASGEALVALRRMKVLLIVYLAVGLLVFVGLVFLLIGGYQYAALRFGAIEAGLYIGSGFILLALIVLGIFKLRARARDRRAKERRKSELTTVAVTAALALLPALATRKGILSLAVALVGYKIVQENRRRPPDGPPNEEA